MPRELLLPIPHHIADKVHHLLLEEAESLTDLTFFEGVINETTAHKATALKELADKLDDLARREVIGW